MATEITDALGNVLQVGDVIFYGIRQGNTVSSHPSVVLKIQGPAEGEPEKRLGVAMLSKRFDYDAVSGKYSWKNVLAKGYFYSFRNAIKVHPDYYTEEIRELLRATGMAGQDGTGRVDSGSAGESPANVQRHPTYGR